MLLIAMNCILHQISNLIKRKDKWGHFIRIVLTIPTSAIFTLHPISELKACRFQSQTTIPNVGSDIDLTHAGSLLSSEIS